MAGLVCGQGGSTGAEIIDRINLLSQPNPRGSMRLAVAKSQVFTDAITPIKVEAFDSIQTARGGIAVDPSIGYNITNNTGQDYTAAIVSVGFNLEFAVGDEIEFYLYINDTVAVANSFNRQGAGPGKPVNIYFQAEVPIVAGDVIDIRARNADAGSFTCEFGISSFRVDFDRKEWILL